jgi:hypothetical protein
MSFTTLTATDFVVSSDSVVAPAWSTGLPTLTGLNMITSSNTASPAPQFYLDVYDSALTGSSAQVQFSIAYGNELGSGSQLYNNLVNGMSPSRTTYGQYRNLVYADETMLFNFGTGNTAAREIVALNIDRNRYKESLQPGTLKLVLTYGPDLITSGSTTINLTDDSVYTSNNNLTITYSDAGRVFNLISGSYGEPTSAVLGGVARGYTPSGSYGFFLPDIGTIILNPRALGLPAVSGGISLFYDNASYGFGTLPSSSLTNNAVYNALKAGNCFQLNSQETISANYVFVRIGNQDYNYTNNPSFLSGSSGQLIYPTLINSPQTFPTTVGLYNNNGDLLAVAKMSKPLLKDFTHEALIRVKLDW